MMPMDRATRVGKSNGICRELPKIEKVAIWTMSIVIGMLMIKMKMIRQKCILRIARKLSKI